MSISYDFLSGTSLKSPLCADTVMSVGDTKTSKLQNHLQGTLYVKNGSPVRITRVIVVLVICSQCSVQFSHSVVSDSWRPHGPQHARPPCPSPSPAVYSDSGPSSGWFPQCYVSIVVVLVFPHLCVYLGWVQYFLWLLTTYFLTTPDHLRLSRFVSNCPQGPHQVTITTFSCADLHGNSNNLCFAS